MIAAGGSLDKVGALETGMGLGTMAGITDFATGMDVLGELTDTSGVILELDGSGIICGAGAGFAGTGGSNPPIVGN